MHIGLGVVEPTAFRLEREEHDGHPWEEHHELEEEDRGRLMAVVHQSNGDEGAQNAADPADRAGDSDACRPHRGWVDLEMMKRRCEYSTV